MEILQAPGGPFPVCEHFYRAIKRRFGPLGCLARESGAQVIFSSLLTVVGSDIGKSRWTQSINTCLCCCQGACETSRDPTWNAASKHRKDVGWLEDGQNRAMKIIQGLENLSCKNKLRELGLIILEKRRLQRLYYTLSVPKGD